MGISISECFSLSPRPMEVACIGPDECYTHSEVVLQEKNLTVKIELWIVNSYWKWKSLSRVNSLRPHDCTVHGLLQARILEWVAFPFSRVLPNPGIKLRSPALQTDSLPAEPQEKPKNTGVGSLSFLQRIFPIQESNCGLLHCRWILYQLRKTLNFLWQRRPCIFQGCT